MGSERIPITSVDLADWFAPSPRIGAIFRMLVSSRVLWRLAYGTVALFFTWIVAHYYIPGKGFTYLIEFGELNHRVFLPEVKAVNHFEVPGSHGYDGQWYAQIAVRPHVGDPELNAAVDLLPYRARRILFAWTAWAAGFGDPIRVLNAYALQNVICWYILAALLMRWFPPQSFENFFRWGTLLFSFGLVFSVRASLVDGPSLLLVALGMALIETKRPFWAALVLGVSGLGKDTSVLSASALTIPNSRRPRAWILWLSQVVMILSPVILWVICLEKWIGGGNSVGTNNFSYFGQAFYHKALDATATLLAEGRTPQSVALFDFAVLLGLLAQFLFFLVHIRWRDSWWRLGASYAALMVFLGDSVWADYPSAAARVLLPMTLAFNILVPRGRWWPVVLLIGNLGVIGSADFLRSTMPDTISDCYVVEGPWALRFSSRGNFGVAAEYGSQTWWSPERERMPGKRTEDYWRWSSGDSSISIHNPQPFGIVADVSFGLATVDPRTVTVTRGDGVVWVGPLKPDRDNDALIPGLVLGPGDTVLRFHSDRPAVRPEMGEHRLFAFSVRDLKIVLVGRH